MASPDGRAGPGRAGRIIYYICIPTINERKSHIGQYMLYYKNKRLPASAVRGRARAAAVAYPPDSYRICCSLVLGS